MKLNKIGKRIKMLMEEKDVTLEMLAERTGFDKDFLVSMQEDDVVPSLMPLLKVARALGIRLGTFIDDHISKDPLVVRKDSHKEELDIHRGKNKPISLKFFSLGAGKIDRHMEPFYIEALPESAKEKKLSSHEGEEFMVVLTGQLEVIYGQETHMLNPGDSIYYNSIVPHYVSCKGDVKATFYAVLYFA